MEYPWAKWKQSNKNKVQYIGPSNKEIKNLCNSEEKNLEHMYTHGWFMSMYGKTTTIL